MAAIDPKRSFVDTPTTPVEPRIRRSMGGKGPLTEQAGTTTYIPSENSTICHGAWLITWVTDTTASRPHFHQRPAMAINIIAAAAVTKDTGMPNGAVTK